MTPHPNLVCETEFQVEVSFVLDTLVSNLRSDQAEASMNNIIYIGAVVIVLVMSFVGLV